MLRFGLVLLLASSAFAASLYDDNGVRSQVEYIVDLFNGADVNINIVTLNQITSDVASLRDSRGLALSQALAVALATANGVPGDACSSAALIDAYASGNYNQALRNWIQAISNDLQTLVLLAKNPEQLRFKSGPRSGCKGAGKVYQFEAAWNGILDNATPSNSRLLNEEYCVAKNLYNGLDSRSNNAAALYTAASLPPTQRILAEAQPAIENLVNVLSRNGNANQALSEAQQALARAAGKC